jgi:hypothetical protein
MSFICFIVPAPLAPVPLLDHVNGPPVLLLSSYRALKAAVKRVREQPRATAMLLAEDGNPHDPSAVSVWIDGLLVGYLPRDQASALRPGLLAAQEREGKPIALEGVIVRAPCGTVAGTRPTTSPPRVCRALLPSPPDGGW